MAADTKPDEARWRVDASRLGHCDDLAKTGTKDTMNLSDNGDNRSVVR